ncbi:MAG TPA: phosphate acyltransferase PlsX [Acidimicrobiales bacterium]|nr:phosphate acyltransferase PlsX [Acidimicrobiales bacterium]
MSEAVPGLPVAVDVMGGDKAPEEIAAGALQAAQETGVPVLLIGDPDYLKGLPKTPGVQSEGATEVIGMDEDPGRAVRLKRDSSLVRCAEAVRDGRASAMVSAGNTGAAMASALLRMGRLHGVSRPAIATIIPVPGAPTQTVLIDSGANVDCTAHMLVQFAQMGWALATERFGIAEPRVGLLSIGEEATKGNDIVKEAHELLATGAAGPQVKFIGNVEGRDVMTDHVDVVVTDGFTGNVVLKTLEGGVKAVVGGVLAALTSTEDVKEAARAVMPALMPLAAELDPDTYGGAVLLGVNGVCVIGHGSSSARAVVNAIKVAQHAVEEGLVARIEAVIGSARSVASN